MVGDSVEAACSQRKRKEVSWGWIEHLVWLKNIDTKGCRFLFWVSLLDFIIKNRCTRCNRSFDWINFTFIQKKKGYVVGIKFMTVPLEASLGSWKMIASLQMWHEYAPTRSFRKRRERYCSVRILWMISWIVNDSPIVRKGSSNAELIVLLDWFLLDRCVSARLNRIRLDRHW